MAYFALLLLTLILLGVGVCEDDSTVLFITRPNELQFISTRIMQCKYAADTASQALPWLFVLVAPFTAFLYDTTMRCIVRPYQIQNYLLMLAYLFLMTVGGCLVVRFDEVNVVGVYNEIEFTGFTADSRILHAMGVVLLFLGISCANFILLYEINKLRRTQTQHILVQEYAYLELCYLCVLLAFLITFVLRQELVAASMEYVLAFFVLLFSILCRQVYYVMQPID